MKNIILLGLLLTTYFIQSQTLEDKLEKITSKIALNLKNKGNYKIAVYPFTSLKQKESNLSMHIFGEFHVSLKAKEYNFSVMDRATIESYLAEHKLNSEGLIDYKTAKKFGKLIAADAYVTSKVYIFGSVINFTVKVTDTQTGEIISFNSEKIPINYDMAQFLEIKNWEEKRDKAEVNKSQNKNCNTLNVGNYCFFNNTSISHEVRLDTKYSYSRGRSKKILLLPNSKSCFKDLAVGTYFYKIVRTDRPNIAGLSNTVSQSNFTVKKCTSRLQKISTNLNNRIVKPISQDKLFTIKIINPNYYSRKLKFSNRNNETEYITVGAQSSASIQLPKGFYRFVSQTTFTNYTVQQSTFTLNRNKTISLAKDHNN